MLVAVLFLYSLFYHGTVNLQQAWSPFYVSRRIFRFSLVSSVLMFVSLAIALVLLVIFKVVKPKYFLRICYGSTMCVTSYH